MIDFGPIIIENGLIQKGTQRERKTVRAIIMNSEKELLMVYSSMFDDYTFPGGGVKHNEQETDALKRELNEELGALSITIKAHIGHTIELRYGIHGNDQIFLQTSEYYFCEILQFGENHLAEREIMHGLEPKWVKIDDALKHNMHVMNDERHQVKGLKTVMIRENNVLRTLKEKNIETI